MDDSNLKMNELLYTRHQSAKERYVYFLLAVAASAITLSVQQTRGSVLSWTQLPLAMAVVLWGASFFAGCRNREWSMSYYIASQQLLHLGNQPWPSIVGGVDQHEQRHLEEEEKIDRLRAEIGIKLRRWSERQFWLLVAGAAFYLLWHVLEMVVRTSAATSAVK